jgi:predicted RNA-binding Zn-ribbon protein involved in translation (DUF1610 family)
MYSNEPWEDEQARQDELEKHQSRFPNCEQCGYPLMNEDKVIKIGHKYYCDACAEVLTNDEMRKELLNDE